MWGPPQKLYIVRSWMFPWSAQSSDAEKMTVAYINRAEETIPLELNEEFSATLHLGEHQGHRNN